MASARWHLMKTGILNPHCTFQHDALLQIVSFTSVAAINVIVRLSGFS